MGIVFGRNRNKMVQAATTAVTPNNTMKNSGSNRKLPTSNSQDKENNDASRRDENINQGKYNLQI